MQSLGGVTSATDKSRILAQHNSMRKQYGAKALTWSVWLAAAAQVRCELCTFMLGWLLRAVMSKSFSSPGASMRIKCWQSKGHELAMVTWDRLSARMT